MKSFSRSFIIEATNMTNDSVKNYSSYASCADDMGVGLKWIKRSLRTNGDVPLRDKDGNLWLLKVKFATACKLIPSFEGDTPIQYPSSYTAAISLLGCSRRTFYKHKDSVPLGESFVIKDCFKREWICCCYQQPQETFYNPKKVQQDKAAK